MKKILVLDDDQDILDLLRIVFGDAGYETIVGSGPEAIPAEATADLVITDLVPLKAYRRDAALDWVASLRSRFIDAPLFILTAHRDAIAERDMLGADAVIMKPFDVDALLTKIEDYMRKTP